MLELQDVYGATAPTQGTGVRQDFDLGEDVVVNLDVALITPAGDLCVGESKRWKEPVPQEYLFAFAQKLTWLKEKWTKMHPGVGVRGVFVVKAGLDPGARAVAARAGISLAVLGDGQHRDKFGILVEEYDRAAGNWVIKPRIQQRKRLEATAELGKPIIVGDNKIHTIGTKAEVRIEPPDQQ